jgi:hypothetical protein
MVLDMEQTQEHGFLVPYKIEVNMKHVYVFLVVFMASIGIVYSKQITLNIPDEEIAIVENDVVDAEQWIKDAWSGKVNKCKERLVKQEVDQSIKDGETLPAGKDAIVSKHFARPDYKSRKEAEKVK